MNIIFKELTDLAIDDTLHMMEQFYLIDGYSFDRKTSGDNLTLFLQHKELGCLWQIFVDGNLAGYIVLAFSFSFEFKGRIGVLDELFLLKSYRGMGVGEAAIRYVAEWAEEAGIKALRLEVENHNKTGMRLYEKIGFKEHKRTLMTLFLP